MSKTNFLRSSTAAFLAAAVFATSSMMALAAAPGKAAMGELIVSGSSAVTVNGEAANTGRTIFSSNTIATPADSSATVNLGKLGQIELAPGSNISLSFSETNISGVLSNGRVKISSGAGVSANVQTQTGEVVAESNQAKNFIVTFDGAKTNVASESGIVTLKENGNAVRVGQQTSDDDDDDGFFNAGSGVIYAIVFGAAAATIIYIAASDSNEININTGGTVVSPTR